MDLIWSIISVFGLASLLLLVVGFWTHWDMTRKEREREQHSNDEKANKPRSE